MTKEWYFGSHPLIEAIYSGFSSDSPYDSFAHEELKGSLEADDHCYCGSDQPMSDEDFAFCGRIFQVAAERGRLSMITLLFKAPHFEGVLESEWGYEWSRTADIIWMGAFKAGVVPQPKSFVGAYGLMMLADDELLQEMRKIDSRKDFGVERRII